MCTIGILVIALLGIPIPNPEVVVTLPKDEFLVANYWRVCWGLPIIFSFIQVMIMLTFFKYSTPKEMMENNEEDKLYELLNKMYVKEHVEMRYQEIKKASSGTDLGPASA